MRILGIDPGLATVGIGVVDAPTPSALKAIDWCTIETEKSLPAPERLLEIRRDLAGIVAEYEPDLAVVERLFFAVNTESALGVAEARGVILSTLAEAGLPILEPTPLELKRAITGDGQADKKQMQTMVVATLDLDETPTPADAADALALAIFGAVQSPLHAELSRR